MWGLTLGHLGELDVYALQVSLKSFLLLAEPFSDRFYLRLELGAQGFQTFPVALGYLVELVNGFLSTLTVALDDLLYSLPDTPASSTFRRKSFWSWRPTTTRLTAAPRRS